MPDVVTREFSQQENNFFSRERSLRSSIQKLNEEKKNELNKKEIKNLEEVKEQKLFFLSSVGK